MNEQLDIEVAGRLGVITLARPEAINALSAGMIAGIAETLAGWADDERICAVLFEGRGPRGFCSGGDVRAARALVIEGRRDEAADYFTAEYAMNGVIAGYGKPVLAIAEGIVMGGGIGIAGHADFRFTTPEARFAMPEAGIGFFSDVGVNCILAKAPEHRALLFLMSGAPVGAADALALGITDCAVAPERLGELRLGIGDAAEAANVEAAIVALMQRFSIQAGERTLCDTADRLEAELALPTAAEIVAAIGRAGATDPEAARMAELLGRRSPTSLEAIVQAHRAARRLPEIADVLALDRRMAHYLMAQPDFAEGVRAVLVDKDQAPRWQDEVPYDEIARVVAQQRQPAAAI